MTMEKIYEIANDVFEAEANAERLSWVLYTAGYDFGVEEAYNKINEKLSSERSFESIEKLYENDSDLTEKQKREIEILYNKFKPFHLSKEVNELSLEIDKLTNELSKVLNSHRSKINGKEISSVDIAQILSTEDNREKRKEAFLARTQVNRPLVEQGFVKLIELRKEYAKLRGFNDFVELKLDDEELNTELFADWKSQLKGVLPKMKEARTKVAQKYLKIDKLMPWDQTYVVSKIAPAMNKTVDMSNFYSVLRKFFLKFGLDLSKYNITYDVFPRANKSEWGYNFPIEVAKDSRILANVKNLYNEYNVLLHESGHGIHSFLMNPCETVLNAGVSGIISEGIANLFASFIYEEIFYRDFLGNDPEVKEQFAALKEYSKINSLRAINDIMFDQDLYRNEITSLDDINKLAFKTQKELLGEEAYADEYPWGYRIHHTTHPIYLHNYFMGDVTCEMLKKVFCKTYNCSSILEKPLQFSEFLITNVISPSGMYAYPDLFKRISGEKFSLKYML
ncbi:M3 family metallopeptidase [Clostridium oryzae]|uniref:Peptidase family M3 n=1 Tax=Clostridium oryzae TaxID=1450648 RepID=A0A1V4IQT3_9CLOT|nr:M3 family metallopeptidase [Clostridium oryzae]OPJ62229.1 peptidase family M3 [Clostridium oryzae]